MDTTSVLSANTPFQHVQSVWYQLVTLFLFTKSDFKTVVLPQSLFAYAVVVSMNQVGQIERRHFQLTAWRVTCMLMWVWLHLLVEDISNQRLPQSILEDSENKPWRPIPRGRLTPVQALSLLRIIVGLALLLSICLGSLTPSVTLMTIVWLYNDIDGSSAGVIQRNVLNAVGLACFGWGSVSVLLAGNFSSDDLTLLQNWTILTATAVATTIQTQDLPDMVGDKARGRRTIPLVYGENWARFSVAILVPMWSLLCTTFWQVTFRTSVITLIMALGLGLLVLIRRDQATNEWVWKLWCAWVCMLYILPLFSPDQTELEV